MSPSFDIQSFHSAHQKGEPFVISGPCSAESRDQVMATAKALSQLPQVKLLRAGIWKPRTRPNAFEGIGIKALSWMQEAQAEFGIPAAVEVAKPEHVEACLEHNITNLWVGARTTANPFSVQELADAMKGQDLSVLIKNPLHPDLNLWIGAIERINKAGISKIAAIHRGFYTYENKPFRNLPMWEIPIELKRMSPDLPVICDPSHIAGDRSLLYSISQKAYDLAFDGLMIESHINPAEALTDAAQQISPKDLSEMLNKLVLRQEYGSSDFENTLEKLRFDINNIDQELLMILARRMEITKEIGLYKKENNITVLQIERLRSMVINRLKTGKELGLDKLFVSKLLQLVHKESVQIQTQIMLPQERPNDDLKTE
jgi:chorismate mutase